MYADDDENLLKKRSLKKERKKERKKNEPITNYICYKHGVYLIYIQIIDTKTISRLYSFKCEKNHIWFSEFPIECFE